MSGWVANRLIIGVRLRLYAVLYFSNRFRHWLWNKSPTFIRKWIGIGQVYPKSRKAQESFILVEAQGAVYPFTMSAATVLILALGRAVGFTAEDAMAFGGLSLLVFAGVIALSFVFDRKLLGSDEQQKVLLRRMKTLQHQHSFGTGCSLSKKSNHQSHTQYYTGSSTPHSGST